MEESSLSASEGEMDGEMERDGSGDDIRELRARRHALTHKLAQQQKRRDKIQVSYIYRTTFTKYFLWFNLKKKSVLILS